LADVAWACPAAERIADDPEVVEILQASALRSGGRCCELRDLLNSKQERAAIALHVDDPRRLLRRTFAQVAIAAPPLCALRLAEVANQFSLPTPRAGSGVRVQRQQHTLACSGSLGRSHGTGQQRWHARQVCEEHALSGQSITAGAPSFLM
jgi:hypothetical protein